MGCVGEGGWKASSRRTPAEEERICREGVWREGVCARIVGRVGVCVWGGAGRPERVCASGSWCVCVVCVEGPRLGGLVEEDAGEGDALELVRPHPHARRAHHLRGTFFI